MPSAPFFIGDNMLINNHGFAGSLRISDMSTPVGDRVSPVNTQQASFSPNPPSSGDEVEADNGSWDSSAPITYEYQWQLDEVDIPLATNKTFLVLVGMVGQSLRCIVKATNRYGFTLSITTAVVIIL